MHSSNLFLIEVEMIYKISRTIQPMWLNLKIDNLCHSYVKIVMTPLTLIWGQDQVDSAT